MEKVTEWQHPFVDLFKKFQAFTSPGLAKGNVEIYHDPDIARRCFRVSGAVLSNNCVHLPDPDRTKSMDLTGRYLYIEYQEAEGQLFVIHLDFKISGREPITRLSVGNIEGATQPGSNTIKVTVPKTGRKWTVLCLDIQYLLEHSGLFTSGAVVSFTKSHLLKSLQICANLSIRGIYTSDNVYDVRSLPREMSFKLPKESKWESHYQFVYIPQSLSSQSLRTPPAPIDMSSERFAKSSKHQKDQPSFQTSREGKPPSLEPYPILELSKVLSFSPQVNPDIAVSGNNLYYSSGSIIVCSCMETGKQRFLQGHTEAIGAMDVKGNMIASAQLGEKAIIRIWINDKIASSFQGPYTKVQQVKLSGTGLLAIVGLDSHSRQTIVIFSVKEIETQKKPEFIAKQISDFHILNIKFAPCDPSRLVSCGRENIRFWRIKNGHLPGNPVVLKQHARNTVFTVLDFDCSPEDPKALLRQDVTKFVLVGSKLGLLFQVNFRTQELFQIYKVHEAGVSSLALSAGYCVTGSEDKVLRVWQTDFAEFVLEAEHQGVVCSLHIAEDATLVCCGTSNGGLGILDLTNHSYRTVLRSHTDQVLQLKQQQSTGLLFSLSKDLTIRVWDKEKGEQTYEFMYPKEDPCLHIYPHPEEGYFVAGFQSGIIRVFDIYNTSIREELKCHDHPITCLVYSPDSRLLLAADQDSNYCLYDVKRGYQPVRVLERQLKSKAQSATFSADSRYFATIGDSGTHINFYNSQSYKQVESIFVSNSQVEQLKFSPLNELFAICVNCALRIYSLEKQPVLLREVPPLHRTRINEIVFSPNLNYLATIGADSLLKVWDYEWIKEPHQVFVGHVASGNGLVWADNYIYSAGVYEGIYEWRFLGKEEPIAADRLRRLCLQPEPEPKERELSAIQLSEEQREDSLAEDRFHRKKSKQSLSNKLKKQPELVQGTSVKFTPYKIAGLTIDIRREYRKAKKKEVRLKVEYKRDPLRERLGLPLKHIFLEEQPGRRSYAEKIEGLRDNKKNFKLDFIVGYEKNTHDNLIWNYLYGWFAYSSDNLLIVESLNKERCQKLVPMAEPISCLAISKDMKKIVVASSCAPQRKAANSSLADSSSEKDRSSFEEQTFAYIYILNHEFQTEKTLAFHPKGVQQICFSDNGKFLISVGNFKECSICVWEFPSGKLKASTYTLDKINDVKCMETTYEGRLLEFATVGQDQVHFFGLTKEDQLEYFDVFVPKEEGEDRIELTCCDYVYKNESIYLVCGTASGEVLLLEYGGDFQIVERRKVAISEFVSMRNCNAAKRLIAVAADGGVYHWTESSYLKEGLQPNFYKINLGVEVVSFCMDPLFTEGLFGTAEGISYVNINENYSSSLVGNVSSPPLFTKVINDKHFVTSHLDGKVKLWNLATGEEIRCYRWRGVCSDVLYDEENGKMICFFKNNQQIKLVNLNKFTREQIFVHEESVKPEYEAEDYPVRAFEASLAGRRAKWVAFRRGDLCTLTVSSQNKKKVVTLTKVVEFRGISRLACFEEKSLFFVVGEDGAINTVLVDTSENDHEHYSFMVLDSFTAGEKGQADRVVFDYSKLVPESYFTGLVGQSTIYYRNYIKRLNIMKIVLQTRLTCLTLHETKKSADIYAGTEEGLIEVVNALEVEERYQVESNVNAPVLQLTVSKASVLVTHPYSLVIYRT